VNTHVYTGAVNSVAQVVFANYVYTRQTGCLSSVYVVSFRHVFPASSYLL